LPVRIASSTPGVDPVGSDDVTGLAQPASDVRRPVGDPQGVPPAVFGFKQGQLRAGVRPLAAGEDPHRRRPGGELIPGRFFAKQPGQLCDVRLLNSEGPMRAAGAHAGVIGTGHADLAPAASREGWNRQSRACTAGRLCRNASATTCSGDLAALRGLCCIRART
jgi:hypothetical protein